MALKNKNVVSSGKRKTSVATATIIPGTGIVTINKKSYEQLPMLRRLSIEEPLRIAKDLLKEANYDIAVIVRGGGKESQAEASRLAIARAIVAFTKSSALRKAYATYDKALLVADVRRKEAYKPGDSKARRKRQKSYR